MSDVEKLTVSLEANISKYNANLNEAQAKAAQATAAIEAKFADLNKAVAASAAQGAQKVASTTERLAVGMTTAGRVAEKSVPTYDKVAAGMSDVGKAALGAQVANELASTAATKAAAASDALGDASSHVSTQAQAAFHSVRSMAEGFALGLPPTQVLAQQMNHLSYAAAGPGGLKAAFQGVLQIFSGLFTPFRLIIAGFAGVGLGATAAGISFANARSKIDLALTGVGNLAGITTGEINKIAESVAKTGDISESEAANIAEAIASTGKVSADATEKATALAHAYSLVFGTDLTKSAQQLGQALAEPAKGIDDLNERLGAWNAHQVELVKNLAAAGNREAAGKIIIDGLQQSIGDAASKTDIWTRAWDGLTNAASNAFRQVGKDLNQGVGAQTPEDQLAAVQARLAQLQGQGRRGIGLGGVTNASEIAATLAQIDQLTTKVNALHKAADDSREAVDVSNIVKNIDPTIQHLDELQATIDRIKAAPVLDDASSAVRDRVVKSLESEKAAIQSNLDLAKQRYNIASAQVGLDSKASAVELAAINARTPAQRAEIAYQQTLLSLLNTKGVSPREAEIEAQIARTKVLAQSQHDLSEAERDRVYQAGQSVAQAEVENSTLGLSIGAATTLTQRFQLLAAARAEANKNGTVVKPEEIAAMDKAAEALGRLAQANAAVAAQKSVGFDISQLGRIQSEQNVYGALNSAGLLDNGEIVSEQAKMTAELFRTKEALTQLSEVEHGFASDFLHDLQQGKSAAEALGDALNNVANKLLDLGIDNLLSLGNKSILDNFTGLGYSGSIGFAGGGPVSGPGSATSDSVPAMLSDGEFVVNADAAKKHRVLLEAINFGKVGKFANGGAVGGVPSVNTPSFSMPNINARSASSIPSGPPQVNMNVTLNVANGSPEGIDRLNGETLPKLKQIIRSEIHETFSRSARFRGEFNRK